MLIIVGLAGAGKSSVLKKFSEERRDIKIVNYGDLAFQVALKKKFTDDRDKINLLPMAIHRKIQKEVVKRLKDSRKTILDTHAVLKHEPGYLAGITPDLLKKINIEGFVFIDASSEEIISRRLKDKTRTRTILTREQIDSDRLLCKMLISGWVSQTGAPFYFIHNKEGAIDKAVNELNRIVEDLRW
ncbi:MAG: AAA family ATPase [Candidatus Micrarchaeia archaeon]